MLCSPGMVGIMAAFTNHGNPKQSRTSNTFEPIELLIPMDPRPKRIKIIHYIGDHIYIYRL